MKNHFVAKGVKLMTRLKEMTEKRLLELLLMENVVMIHNALLSDAEQLQNSGFEEAAEKRREVAKHIMSLAEFIAIAK